MRYPKLIPPKTYRETVEVFRGINRNPQIGQGEFSDMENLSSDAFPVLSPRKPRRVYAAPENCLGMIAKDSLCYVDGSRFVMNGYPVEMNLSDSPKQLVSMGGYVVIFPDKKYINTLDLSDFGSLEAYFTANGSIRVSPCDMDGNDRTPDFHQAEVPAEPGNMQLWLDTSAEPPALKQWAASEAMWVGLDAVYVKLSYPGIGKAFRPYDSVTVSGLGDDLDGSAVLWATNDDYVVISGLSGNEKTLSGPVTLTRTLPEMDFVIENGNRLWGCRYGTDENGNVVNEIYASRLGDFKNWNSFLGLASDSYAVSVGSDGPFTGAVSHLGYPLFFKETCLHKIYGSYPANFYLQTTACRGVQRGSQESLAIVGETLLYKSPQGVCAYDGSLPQDISAALGPDRYENAAAGAADGKYYIRMDRNGETGLFVYDSRKDLWHKEDSLKVSRFCFCRGTLYALEEITGRILALTGEAPGEETVSWMAQTGLIGGYTMDAKYLAKIALRMGLAPGAQVELALRYDSMGPWETVGILRGSGTGSFTVPLRPRRCDHLHLRLRGKGDARIYALTKVLEQGGDSFDN